MLVFECGFNNNSHLISRSRIVLYLFMFFLFDLVLKLTLFSRYDSSLFSQAFLKEKTARFSSYKFTSKSREHFAYNFIVQIDNGIGSLIIF